MGARERIRAAHGRGVGFSGVRGVLRARQHIDRARLLRMSLEERLLDAAGIRRQPGRRTGVAMQLHVCALWVHRRLLDVAWLHSRPDREARSSEWTVTGARDTRSHAWSTSVPA